MPTYCYLCPSGHVTEAFARMRAIPDGLACLRCGRLSRRSFLHEARTQQVIGEIPEHWNISLGLPVRGRRHLRELQREHGCQDWEPVVASSTVTEARRKLRRRRVSGAPNR